MIVLDTHAWLWWVSDPAKLGRGARAAIEAAVRIGVPAICCFEVAVAAARGRIVLDRQVDAWLEAALSLPRVELLPLTPRVAVRAALLERFHGDPADRLVVATALIESSTIVTRDWRIRRYRAASSVW